MKALTNNQPGQLANSSVSTSTHWLWWVFLLGVLACAGVGPSCAYH